MHKNQQEQEQHTKSAQVPTGSGIARVPAEEVPEAWEATGAGIAKAPEAQEADLWNKFFILGLSAIRDSKNCSQL